MKNKILSIVFAGFALLSVSAASAHQENNWYVQANGSMGFHNKSKFSNSRGNTTETWTSKQKHGYGGSVAVGRIIDCWRIELEASQRCTSSKQKQNDPKETNPATTVNYKGNTSFMANVYYDIPLDCDFTFYVGAGAGLSLVNGTVHNEFTNGLLNIKHTRKNNLDQVFAWQLMTGVSYELCENWDIILGYRFFATTKPTFYDAHGSKIKAKKTPYSNNIELGLRFKF